MCKSFILYNAWKLGSIIEKLTKQDKEKEGCGPIIWEQIKFAWEHGVILSFAGSLCIFIWLNKLFWYFFLYLYIYPTSSK